MQGSKEDTCQTYRKLSASSLLRHQLLHPLLPDAFQLRIILCQVLLSIISVMQLTSAKKNLRLDVLTMICNLCQIACVFDQLNLPSAATCVRVFDGAGAVGSQLNVMSSRVSAVMDKRVRRHLVSEATVSRKLAPEQGFRSGG